jgi:ribA/ribD-fused uncharacterized protein
MSKPPLIRTTDTHVYFYGGPLSQWYPARFSERLAISLDDTLVFNCAEQYMMARKAFRFGDIPVLEAIMATANPAEQKALGRKVQGFNEAIWNEMAPGVVLTASLAKFSQAETLRNYLLGTGDRHIVEGSSKDRIYGVGLSWDDPRIEDEANWLGANHLGRCLMAARGIIRHVPTFKMFV